MSYLDSTLTDMTREELESELLKVKDTNTSNMKRKEHFEQQLYEIKRELSTAHAMEEHLSSEIESLQSADRSVSHKLMKKLKALDEEILLLKQTNAQTIQFYESQLHELDLEINVCKENRKTEGSNTNEKVNKETVSEYEREIAELESKIKELQPAVSDSEAKYTEVAQNNDVLETKITELSGVMSELQECFNSKKQEVQENKELVQSLQDEIYVLQMDLDKLKNVPVEKATKGNSMFAELNDNCVKLKKYMQMMNRKYADIKLKYANKSQELKNLHANYALLTKQIEEKNTLHEDQCYLVETFKKDFDSLTESINRAEKELEVRNVASTESMTREMKCAEELITITRKEILKLQKEIYSESLARITSDQRLYETKQELQTWQTDAMQLRINALMLNQTIEELKLRKTTTPQPCTENKEYLNNYKQLLAIESQNEKPIEKKLVVKENTTQNEYITIKHIHDDPFLKANSKATETVTLKQEVDIKMEENKENNIDENIVTDNKNTTGTKKKVNFSANTLEPRMTDRSRRKKTVPCVHIPSIKRE